MGCDACGAHDAYSILRRPQRLQRLGRLGDGLQRPSARPPQFWGMVMGPRVWYTAKHAGRAAVRVDGLGFWSAGAEAG